MLLEEKRLDGLNQTLPLSIVVLELLVIPDVPRAGVTIIGQRFADLLETYLQCLLECLRLVLRADHEHSRP